MEATPATQETLRDMSVVSALVNLYKLISQNLGPQRGGKVYDHILTFPQEIEVIWKQKKTFFSCVFLLVRPLLPSVLHIIVEFLATGYFSTDMTRERCAQWMLFLPLGVTVPLSVLPSFLMSIRVWAMYTANRTLLILLLLYLAAQTAAVELVCVYLPPKKIGHFSIMFVSMEVAFDCLVFLLTASRTVYMHYHRRREFAQSEWTTGLRFRGWTLLESLVKDGALYFAAIFSINFTWVIMILYAPTGLRAIAGHLFSAYFSIIGEADVRCKCLYHSISGHYYKYPPKLVSTQSFPRRSYGEVYSYLFHLLLRIGSKSLVTTSQTTRHGQLRKGFENLSGGRVAQFLLKHPRATWFPCAVCSPLCGKLAYELAQRQQALTVSCTLDHAIPPHLQRDALYGMEHLQALPHRTWSAGWCCYQLAQVTITLPVSIYSAKVHFHVSDIPLHQVRLEKPSGILQHWFMEAIKRDFVPQS
ncbi:hypothetical protein BC835DRAFT_1311306 [Cytidiella melzeri]|nr:hypothetical protein BC835DRAFT_1311306 [Cytidiella melzeri]